MYSNLENILINTYKKSMVEYINENPQEFDKLVQLIFTEKQAFAWRAAWLTWSCMEENDKRIEKYVHNLIDCLPVKPGNMRKDIYCILAKMDVDEDLEGRLFDQCISDWENLSNEPAVRANAFKIIIKIGKKYPELLPEIKALTKEMYFQNASKGLQKSVTKRLSQLD
jgi:hypothetical protein